MWKKADKDELKLAPSMDWRPEEKKKSLLRKVGEGALLVVGLGVAGVACVCLWAAEQYLDSRGGSSGTSGSSGYSGSHRGYGNSVWTVGSGGKKTGSWSSGRHK